MKREDYITPWLHKKRPEVVVFAGPNGSCESAFTELLKPPIDHISVKIPKRAEE